MKLGNVEFLIARAENDNYNKLFIELYEKNMAKLEAGGDEAEELSIQLSAEVTAKTILLGWKGEVGYKGKPMKYSVENAMKLLSDPQMKEFRRFVAKQAQDLDNFRAAEEAEQEKN